MSNWRKTKPDRRKRLQAAGFGQLAKSTGLNPVTSKRLEAAGADHPIVMPMSGESSGETVVRCKHLAKTYGQGPTRVDALRGVDLEVQRGELLMLVGPSGCGKTTLISILAAILDADEGECEVLGHDLRRMAEEEKVEFRRKSVGFVFQVFNLLPALTALENVAVPLLIAGLPRAAALTEARRLVESIGLGGRADTLPGRLSGGQQQRIAIARAMIHAPEMIICDEPTSNLDHATGNEMMKLLRSTGKRGDRALIVVTHDTRIIEFADRVVHMDDGRINSAGDGAAR